MLVSKKEVEELIFKVNKQVTENISKDKFSIELTNREWAAALGLLEDTIYTSPLVHGWENKGRRRYFYHE